MPVQSGDAVLARANDASRSVVERATDARTATRPSSTRLRTLLAGTGTTLFSDAFTESASTANAWLALGNACLTAGTTATPTTSIPACGTAAPQDAAGSGALQLTPAAGSSEGMVLYRTPVSTAAGLQITFSDASFAGTIPGADGITSFFTDASKAMPAAMGAPGGSLGYSGNPGIANAYLGVGFDAYGNFSTTVGGPGGFGSLVPDSIAVRGAASTSYQYIGGYENASGAAASLPFSLDTPSVTTRPASPPTILEQLTAAGVLTVAIDRHDGNGYVTYLSQTVAGTNGEPAVPASVYLGFTGSTGGDYERHLITNFSVTTLAGAAPPATPTPSPTPTATPSATPKPTPSPTPTATPPAVPTATPAPAATDPFSLPSTAPNAFVAAGDACLTAGTSTTPTTSIPACGANAAVDASGKGALQLTTPAGSQVGMVLYKTPLATANGVTVTFTDATFNGSSPGADGLAVFFTDASLPIPTVPGQPGGALGYGNAGGAGLASAYVGIGLDEYGNFSSTAGGPGGPGRTPETIDVRGAASANYPYIGGYLNASNVAASLPFNLDQPAATTRPANAPTVKVLLTAAGQLTVSIDQHNGSGFVQYYTQSIVGVNGQPAVPANVYVGFSAGTGGLDNRHQVSGFSAVAGTGSAPPAVFSPPNIPNLQAWYDASNASGVTQSNGLVSAWKDLSGKSNTLSQATASLEPAYTASGIDSRPSLTFNSAAYLLGTNTAFSTSLFNESTVFVVSNQTNATQSSSVGWSGAYLADPRWNLRLSEAGVSNFDFNNKEAGRLSPADVPNGPAIWTAAGSVSGKVQFLRKDGNTLSSSTGPGATVTGSYPFAVGATVGGGSVSYQYAGQLGEVLVYNRFLTTAETAEVEGYLACEWGLQNRLPANHPYHALCPQGGTTVSLPYPTPSPGALIDPPQLSSSGGSLTFNVVASQNAAGAPQLTYDGSNVPPTLRLLAGDTLIVNLINNLPTPPAGATYLNDTNLHYHGLHVSPNAPSDDSIDMIAMPGQSLQYRISIPPTHPTGLYWYHSHAHGEAERQNLSGMSGALIIDGISQYAPQVENMPERILIARDVLPAGQALPAADRRQVAAMFWAMQHASRNARTLRGMAPSHMTMSTNVRGTSTLATRNPYVLVDPRYRHSSARTLATSTHCTGTETAAKNWTLNGQTVPSIGIRPGEQQFWRFVNAGSDTYLDLAVDNTQMQIVALDGVPLASVGNAPMTVSHYLVPPASRIEFIVTGPAAGTTSYLRTNCFDSGSAGPAMPATILAQLNPASSLSDASKHRDRAAKYRTRLATTHTVAYIRRFAATQGIARTQTLTYSDQNTINGQSYDPGAPAQFYAQSGTMEQWQIVNNSSQVHTFHIHQIHFLVDQVVGGTAIEQSNVGQVLDNINVPAASANGPGTVTLTMDFTDPLIIGTFLLHCHILSHEDAGMMAKITVGTAPPLTNNAPNGVSFASSTAASQNVTLSGGAPPYSVSGCAGVATATVSGSVVTIKPSGAGSCVLTIADSTSLTTTVVVNVAAPAAPISVTPNALSYTSPTAATQTATITGGTPSYGVAGCSGIASAAVSGSTVSVVPQAVGSCTLTITDSALNTGQLAITVNAPATGSAADNVTFHQNAGRQGWYQAETQLTTTNVASSSFKLLRSLVAPSGMPAFGKVYAQPLYASAESIGGTKHNLVIVATATDQVYAFDDQTYAVVWERSFTGSGVTQQSWTSTGCGDVNPDIGITSTPVIDRAKDTMYVVVPTNESGTFHIRLHAISLQNGADLLSPVEVSASTMLATGGAATTSAEYNFSRTALLEANGNIYVGLGSHCDYNAGATHGWLLAYNATNLAPAGSAVDLTNSNTGGNYYLGSIWMGGYGPAADAQGNVYFVTGNGPWDGSTNFSMSVLKLPGTLSIASGTYFTPINESSLSNGDQDFGSGGIMLLPDGLSSSLPHLAMAGGKDGTKYLLNRDNLGGQQTVEGGGIWGGPAFFQDSNGTSYVVYGTGSPLSTYAFTPATATLTSVASINFGCLECRDSGSQPIVSSNGTNPGTAIAWALQTPGGSGGTISLVAFDALKMTKLFQGAAGPWNVTSGASYIGGALVSPVVANGRVYVPTDGSVAVFGLSP